MMQDDQTRMFDPELLPDSAEYYASKLNKLKVKKYPIASACCPFHDDKLSSLEVNLDSGLFYCCSCGERGENILDFTMQKSGCNYDAAVTELGAWAYE